jgi:hypothetical protein
MEARWIPVLVGGRAPFFDVFLCLVSVCVLLRKTWRWRLPEDGIRSSPSSPRSGGAYSVVGRCVEVCLRRISLDLIGVPSDLRFSSSVMVSALVRWFFGALARRLPVSLLQQALLQQVLPGSAERGARTATRLRLARVLVVVARRSKDLFVIFITFEILCTDVEDYK